MIFDLSGTLIHHGFSDELFEGVPELLHELKQGGLNLHVWTSLDDRGLPAFLKHYGIDLYFTTMSGATQQGRKPLAQNLKFKPGPKTQMIMIGDSTVDMQAAKNIGAVAGAALYNHQASRDSLAASGAEVFFWNLSDIQSFLLSKE